MSARQGNYNYYYSRESLYPSLNVSDWNRYHSLTIGDIVSFYNHKIARLEKENAELKLKVEEIKAIG